jgi:hypothetical protein
MPYAFVENPLLSRVSPTFLPGFRLEVHAEVFVVQVRELLEVEVLQDTEIRFM